MQPDVRVTGGAVVVSMSKSVLFFAVLLLTVLPVAPDRRTIPLPLPLTVLERIRVPVTPG